MRTSTSNARSIERKSGHSRDRLRADRAHLIREAVIVSTVPGGGEGVRPRRVPVLAVEDRAQRVLELEMGGGQL